MTGGARHDHRDGAHRVRQDERREGAPELSRLRGGGDVGDRWIVRGRARRHRAGAADRRHLSLPPKPGVRPPPPQPDAQVPALRQGENGHLQHLLAREAQPGGHVDPGRARGGRHDPAREGPGHERRNPDPGHQTLAGRRARPSRPRRVARSTASNSYRFLSDFPCAQGVGREKLGQERPSETEAGMQQDARRASLGVGGAFAPFAESLEVTLPGPLALSDVAKMTPIEIAQSSALVTSSYQELVSMALSLENEAYRRLMLSILKDTRVTFMELYPERSDREGIRGELARFGYMSEEDDVDELFPPRPEDPQPYLASPQSHEDLYNPHPGGMAITCAVNCRLSEYHTMLYREHFGVPANRDLAVAGLCIHEYP